MVDFEIKDNVTRCTLTDGNKTYVGVSTCHPEDRYSEIIGKDVAYYRAVLQQAKEYKREVEIEFRVIKQVFDAIRLSPKFNEDSNESEIISRKYCALESELRDWRFCVKALRTQINESINSRAKYERLKAGLNKAND